MVLLVGHYIRIDEVASRFDGHVGPNVGEGVACSLECSVVRHPDRSVQYSLERLL